MCCQVTEPAQEGEEPNPEERRVLERKLKKIRRKEEKAQLKAEGKTVEKVAPEKVLPSRQNLDYLTLRMWASDPNRAAWKFQKHRQTWLLQQMYDSEKVPDESFPVLLLYIEGLRGAARDLTVQKAEALVKSLGDGPWDPEQQQKMQRAREVLQLLS
uniref:Zmp:0000000624 n=1 Tax=Gadus morhua TaxID=8049 RepID=A0A8C5D1Y7_GADMO